MTSKLDTQNTQSVVITGCSTGIGAHCAKRLKDDGYRVLASARKPEDIARLEAEGIDAFYLEHRDPSSIDAFCDWAIEKGNGQIVGWFNNAGYAQPGAVEDLPMAALREQMEVNLFAYHHMMLRAVPVMRAQGFGRIVNCSSVLGRVPMAWRGAYNCSKFALDGLTVTLRHELEGSGIFACVINTGPIPSSIAVNALRYAEKYLEPEKSVHHQAYASRLSDLASQRPPEDSWGSEPVYKALRHALTAKRPKPHYAVTAQTRIAFLMDRLLPKDILYRLLTKKA